MSKRAAVLIVFALMLVATSASASVFTVVLTSGQTFDTRYYPLDAEWDESVYMLLSDQGNWIAIQKQDVAEITSAVEEGGFGHRIDTSTVVVGWTYNDGEDGEGGEGGEGAGTQAGGVGGVAPGGVTPGGDAGQPVDDGYNIDQFVNTGSAGASGGIPLEYTTYQ